MSSQPHEEERTIKKALFVRQAGDLGPLLCDCPCERCAAVRHGDGPSVMVPFPVFVTLSPGEYFAIMGLSDYCSGDRACNLYNLGKLALQKNRLREAKALFEECASCVTMANAGSLIRHEGQRSVDEIPDYRNLRDYMVQLSMTKLTDLRDDGQPDEEVLRTPRPCVTPARTRSIALLSSLPCSRLVQALGGGAAALAVTSSSCN